MHIITNFPYLLTAYLIEAQILSSSAYIFPCNISVILIATGMVRDLPIV
jgi:hypothetical protein